tara:strand:+ start:210 stop:335 length:126 start_codon:yes stop_codon:yes gene_type:complete
MKRRTNIIIIIPRIIMRFTIIIIAPPEPEPPKTFNIYGEYE